MKVIHEFKEFAIKGNVVDLAVGVVIGASFGKIVTSLVNDIIMPPISLLLGGVDFSHKSFVIKQATESASAISINYGLFINNIIDFLIVSFAIFFVIRQINRLKREKPEPTQEQETPADIKLLTEIRDLLNK